MEKSPWKTLSRKLIYENPWIQLHEDSVINPSGNPGVYGRVCMKNKAVGIIPIDTEGNTWLVGQYRYTLNAYSWEIPMGGGPIEEAPLRAAKRELIEETGISAGKWDLLTKIHTSNSVTNEEGFIYVAKNLTMGKAKPEETESLRLKKVPLQQAIQMVRKGKITDAISMVGLLLLANRQSDAQDQDVS